MEELNTESKGSKKEKRSTVVSFSDVEEGQIAPSKTVEEYHDDDEDNGDDDIGGGALTGQDGSFLSSRRAPSFLCGRRRVSRIVLLCSLMGSPSGKPHTLVHVLYNLLPARLTVPVPD